MGKFEQLQEDLFIAIGKHDSEEVRSYVKQARKIGKNEILMMKKTI
ncbi:MAG: hypothetical protein ACR5KV_07380 [Wolbachia sp.]